MKYDLKIIRECCKSLYLNLDKTKEEILVFQRDLREDPLVIKIIKILETLEEKIQINPSEKFDDYVSCLHVSNKFKEILIGLIIEKHVEGTGPIIGWNHGSYQSNLKVLLNRAPQDNYIKDIYYDFCNARNIVRNYLLSIWLDPRVYKLRDSCSHNCYKY